ncbi:MAG: phospholipid carrier-dependent glycosyltransferase [Chitinophagales bacterium]
MGSCVPHYGLNFDDALHAAHGWVLHDFFSGKNKEAQVSPYNDKGELLTAFEGDRDLRGMNIFPGAFDLLSMTIHKIMPSGDLFQQRHWLIFLFSVIAVLCAGLIAKEWAGPLAGTLAMLFLISSPRFIGHSCNNPKDIPFAGLYLFSLWAITKWYRAWPVFSWKWFAVALLGITLACDVRMAGLLLYGWLLGAALLGYWPLRQQWPVSRFMLVFLWLALGILISYLAISLLWPYAHTQPLQVPLQSLRTLADFRVFNSSDLYGGTHIDNTDEPRSYILVWEWIGNPIFFGLSWLLLPVIWQVIKNKRAVLLMAVVAAFPIFWTVVKGAYFPHDGRHFLFTYGVAAVFMGLLWNEVLILIKESRKRIVALVILCLIFFAEPLIWMVRNHPNEMCYFNPVFGGVPAAWGNYETDYYGNCMKQCVDYIQAHERPDAQHPVRVRVFYGSQSSAEYFLRKKPGFVYVKAIENSMDWDYSILLTAASKYDNQLFLNWPMIGTVYEPKASGVPLACVYRNYRMSSPADIQLVVKAFLTRNNSYTNRVIAAEALNYAKAYDEAIALCDSALAHQVSVAAAWKQRGIACDFKGDAAGAVAAYRNYTSTNPDPAVAARITQLSGRLSNGLESSALVATLVNNSVTAYQAGRYVECVSLCKAALRVDSNQLVALNNLCASYNALHQFDNAIAVGKRALAVNPNFELAKNNVAVAEQGLKDQRR